MREKQLNEALENSKKRKTEQLTPKEWLTFFILPINFNWYLNSKGYHQLESERFEKFGFDTKVEQVEMAKIAGLLFYLFIIVVIAIIFTSSDFILKLNSFQLQPVI